MAMTYHTPNFTIAKTEPDKMLVFGWGNVAIRKDGKQVADLQGDVIDPEELEKAAYEHVLNFRNAGERHDPALRKKGRLVESCVFTKEKQAAIGIPPGIVPEGWWVGYKIDDPAAWDKIKKGEYAMFSVEGRGERTPIEKAVIAKGYHEAKTMANPRIAKTYSEIRKFNPNHDARGRFSSASSAASFTYAPGKSKAHNNAIARAKDYGEKEAAAAPLAKNAVVKAKEVEKKLTPALESIASNVGGKMIGLEYSVKSEGSLTRKLVSEQIEKGIDAQAALKRMNDINRYTMTHDAANLATATKSALSQLESKGYSVEKIKNTFAAKDAVYRGINVVLKTPDGGKFELQFHTPESFRVKDKINHPYYEEARLTSTSKQRKAELNQIMVDNSNKIKIPTGIEKI